MKHPGSDALPTVLVYQMGKVGSTSVWATLTRSGLAHPMYKAHYLSDEGIAEGRSVFGEYLGQPGALPHGEAVKEIRHLMETEPERRWKVISLVREPIARDVSSFVQLVHFSYPGLVEPTIQEQRIARAASMQFAVFDEARSYHCQWFDREVRSVFGIDVFATPFDHDQKRLRVTVGNVDLLVLRLEDFTAALRPNLAWFLEVEPDRIGDIYASSRHPEKKAPAYDVDVYRRIVAEIRVPHEVAARVYASRYAHHFYTAEELAGFTEKWAR